MASTPEEALKWQGSKAFDKTGEPDYAAGRGLEEKLEKQRAAFVENWVRDRQGNDTLVQEAISQKEEHDRDLKARYGAGRDDSLRGISADSPYSHSSGTGARDR